MELREPAHRASPRAKTYWALTSLSGWLVFAITPIVVALVWWSSPPWWLWVLLAAAIVGAVVEVASVSVKYRVHRWEVTPTAVFSQTGWLNRELRIAPINRVQTLDTERGFLMKRFRLATITVTTASSAGAIKLVCLDEPVADEVLQHLTAVTAQHEDDAT